MKALILGGYGNFGRLIARALKGAAGLEPVIAGRNEGKGRAFAAELGAPFARIDASAPDLSARIRESGAHLVISTAGPFQGQDYRVARAAIAARAHYVDIADGRDFVCGIAELNGIARERGLLVVSGASSVPALSSAVIDRHARDFSELREIDIGICASARTPGDATVRAVLGYCGRPLRQWREGRWVDAYGWQSLRSHRFRQAGFGRWICDCDVPDLALFPSRYPGVLSVRFGAGLQPSFVHLGLWALAAGVRAGVLGNLDRLSGGLAAAARSLERWGSGRSAMFVRLRGSGHDRRPLERTWELVAEGHEGANVPCMAAVRLARKIAGNEIPAVGAMPCLGLVSLDEYLEELRPFRLSWGTFED